MHNVERVVYESLIYAEQNNLLQFWQDKIRHQLKTLMDGYRSVDYSSQDLYDPFHPVIFDSPWVSVCFDRHDLDARNNFLSIKMSHKYVCDNNKLIFALFSAQGWRDFVTDQKHKEAHENIPSCCTFPPVLRQLFYILYMQGCQFSTEGVYINIYPPKWDLFEVFNQLGAKSILRDWNHAGLRCLLEACDMNFKESCRTDTRIYKRFAFSNHRVRIKKDAHFSNTVIIKLNEPLELMLELPSKVLRFLYLISTIASSDYMHESKGLYRTCTDVSIQVLSNVLWHYGGVPIDSSRKPYLEKDYPPTLVSDESLAVSSSATSTSDEILMSSNYTYTGKLETPLPPQSTLMTEIPPPSANWAPTYIPQPGFMTKNQSCKDSFPTVEYCTKEILTSRPECIQTCDVLLYEAIDSLMKQKSCILNYTIFKSPILTISVVSTNEKQSLIFNVNTLLAPGWKSFLRLKMDTLVILQAIRDKDMEFLHKYVEVTKYLPDIWQSIPSKLCETLINILFEYPSYDRHSIELSKEDAYLARQAHGGKKIQDCLYPDEFKSYNTAAVVIIKLRQCLQSDDETKNVSHNTIAHFLSEEKNEEFKFRFDLDEMVTESIYLLLNQSGIRKEELGDVAFVIPDKTQCVFTFPGQPHSIAFTFRTIPKEREEEEHVLSTIHAAEALQPNNYPFIQAFWLIIGEKMRNDTTNDANLFETLDNIVSRTVMILICKALWLILTKVYNFQMQVAAVVNPI